MRLCRPVLVTLLVFGIVLPDQAAGPGWPRLERPRIVGQASPQKVDTGKFEESCRVGIEALYSIDYSTAAAKFDQAVRLNPEHPAGYYYLAKTSWLSTLYAMRRLQVGLYAGNSFFSETGDKSSPSSESVKNFDSNLDKAISKAQARFKKNENDPDLEALYFWGASYSLRATYETTVKQEYTSAMLAGDNAVKQHKKLAEKDADYADAWLSIGLYDYILGTLALQWRVLLKVIGKTGNQAQGLAELRLAAEKGKYASDDARVILCVIYERQGDWQEALTQIEGLCSKYPRNYIYSLDRGAILAQLNRYDESYATYERVLKDERAKPSADLVHYRYAEALFHGGKFERDLKELEEFLKIPTADPKLVSRVHLYRGESFDALNQHSDAVNEYRQVKDPDLKYQARKYEKQPYIPEPPPKKDSR